jgi:hypothetical protein
MNYRQLKKVLKEYNKTLPRNRRAPIFVRSGICILGFGYFFKIFHCLDYGGLIIQEMYDGRWEIHYCEPGRYEETLFLSNDESEACEEYLRLIKKDNYQFPK